MRPTEGETYEEMMEFYLNMTLEEFEQYIRSAYNDEKEFDDKVNNATLVTASSGISTYASSSQRFYYDGVNYFYLDSNVAVEEGQVVYTSFIKIGSKVVSYPAYKMIDYSIDLSTNKKVANCSWDCYKYIAKNVMATGIYTKSYSFKAGGGNIYPVVQC